jgi:hypothetical protein
MIFKAFFQIFKSSLSFILYNLLFGEDIDQ